MTFNTMPMPRGVTASTSNSCGQTQSSIVETHPQTEVTAGAANLCTPPIPNAHTSKSNNSPSPCRLSAEPAASSSRYFTCRLAYSVLEIFRTVWAVLWRPLNNRRYNPNTIPVSSSAQMSRCATIGEAVSLCSPQSTESEIGVAALEKVRHNCS